MGGGWTIEVFRERPLIRSIVGVLMSTGGKGRRGDAFVLRLIFIQNERTSYWVARPERARWFLGAIITKCCLGVLYNWLHTG